MSWPNECWFNVYKTGFRGMLHATRKQCETAGIASYVEQEDIGLAYRVHVRVKSFSQSPAVGKSE